MIKSIFILGTLLTTAIQTPPPLMQPMKPGALIEYSKEQKSLSSDQIDQILDQGMELALKTGLVQILVDGGTALFPHSSIVRCGDQVAAVLYASMAACKQTGKNQILLLGVLHALSKPLFEARQREFSGEDLSTDPCRGIFGPDLPNSQILDLEFSLDHFTFLIEKAAKRYGFQMPKLILRYPNLVDGTPETLTGIEEVKNLVPDSIVVATADLFHHGAVYGEENPFDLSTGLAFARDCIQDHLACFSNPEYLSYREHCLKIKSDSKDVGQLLQYLLGPLKGSI